MTTPPTGFERRIGQRFAFNLPVALRDVSTSIEGLGFTQDVSSRGAFFFTDMPMIAGSEIELTLKMPSEITLGESMHVRCRGRILRIIKPADHGWQGESWVEIANNSHDLKPTESRSGEINSAETRLPETRSSETRSRETKIGVAVCLSGYEYLPEPEDGSADFRRISALHSSDEGDRPAAPAPVVIARDSAH
jgi:hypothetical protein